MPTSMKTRPAILVVLAALACACVNGPAAEPGVPELLKQAQEAAARGRHDEALTLADKAIQLAPKDANAHIARARTLVAKGDLAGAIKSFGRVLELAPNAAVVYQWRGETNFKLGRIKESIADFDQFLRLEPSREPHHWQRGISYYYAGRFADGKRQFETHQTVNPQDVENAVWHFLCNARLNGLEPARKDLIPISGDTRVPMKEVQAHFAGKGTAAQVLAAADAAGKTDADRRGARFYAHLYLGLYFEAAGDAKKAREHIEKAAKDFSEPHYMGDVARVHLQLMNRLEKK